MFNPAKLVYGDTKNAHISVEGKSNTVDLFSSSYCFGGNVYSKNL